jgi:hypothetical protein
MPRAFSQDDFKPDETLDVGSKFGAVFRRGRYGVVFVCVGNVLRIDRRVHARQLLVPPIPREQDKRPNDADQPGLRVLAHPCPCCGGRMIVIETFERGRAPRASSLGEIRIDTS